MPTGILTFLQPFDLVTGLIGIDKVSAVGGQAIYASPTVKVTFAYDVADPTTATSFVIGNTTGSVTYATGDYPVSLFILNLALPGNPSLALAAMLTNLGTMALGPTADVDLSTYVYPGLTLQGNDLGTKFSVSAAATVNAGAGDDEIILGDAPDGVIDGGAGTDTLASGGAGTLEAIVSGDPLNAPDQILIWQGSDFVGAWNVTGVEVYRGSGGDDRFSGAGIGTQFVGAAGSDNFFFSGGEMFADSVDYGQETGGKGVAVNLDWTFNVATADAELAAAFDVLVDGDIPPDTIWINDTYGFNDNAQLGMTIIGTSFADAFNGSAEADVFRAAGGADLIFGGAGEDTLYGGDGNDTINGGEGNDDIDAGEGDDTIVGGAGDNRIEGGAGNDVLRYAGNQDEYSISYDAGVFTIEGDDGTDTVTGVETFMFGDGPVYASSYVNTNTAPTAADKTITIAEDGSHTFAATDFGFSDADAGDTLQSIRITSLPSGGTLKLDGVAVGADDVIAAADIPTLVFVPNANANGATLASFGFKVSDGALESDAKTITLSVTAANDAPTAADKTIIIAEDGSHTFAATDFGFSDVDAGDTLQSIRITSLPSGGALKLGGVAVESDDVVDVGAIATLVFVPNPDANGAPLASFEFKVSDGALESDAKTITLNVTAANDAPTGADKTITIAEDGSHTFAATDFGFSDIDAGDTLQSIRIMSLPSGGTLKLGGVDVSVNDVIGTGAVPTLVFVPDGTAGGTSPSFDFQVSDGALESDAKTITFSVTDANVAPSAADNTITLTEDDSYTFAADDFGFTDADAGDTLQSIRITSLPTGGTLKLGVVAVGVGDVIAVADIPTLVFVPATNANGAPLASFQFKVSDGELESDTKTITFHVTASNDAPTTADKAITIAEDGSYTFAAADFAFNDVDAGDTLQSIRITSVPTGGVLTLNGVTVSDGDVIAAADIATLVFVPSANGNGSPLTSLKFRVSDGALESSLKTITINVTASPDAPVANDDEVDTDEDTPISLSVAQLLANDTDPDAGTLWSIASVTSGTGGTAVLNPDGSVTFTPTADFNGVATFTYKATDGALFSGDATVRVSVAAVNDAPVIGGLSPEMHVIENSTSVGTISAVDTEGDSVSYALVGDDAGLFELVGNQLKFKLAPDFEVRADHNHDNVYEVGIVATGGSSSTLSVAITVDNIGGVSIRSDTKNNTIDKTHAYKGVKPGDEEDRLDGNKGNDKLNGEGGNDTLIGGEGKDTLTGGAGADWFVFSNKLGSTNIDTVRDFAPGTDVIGLDDAIFKKLGTTLDDAEFYAKSGATKAHDKTDRIIYDTKTGKLYYDSDGKGGVPSVHFATLSNKAVLHFDDFAVV